MAADLVNRQTLKHLKVCYWLPGTTNRPHGTTGAKPESKVCERGPPGLSILAKTLALEAPRKHVLSFLLPLLSPQQVIRFST